MGNDSFDDYTKVAMVVGLNNIIKIDRSVLKVADLPIGYCETRNTGSDKWSIAKIDYSEKEMKEFGFYCSNCGIYHKEIPMVYGTDAPLLYYLIAKDQREQRCTLTGDQCIIDDKHYYIRGHIELPVEDSIENFCWSVWVEMTKEDFDKMAEIWDEENRFLEPPFNGELSSQLEPYPQTDGLLVKIIKQHVGYVPKIELLESSHPLYLEQESGINMNRVIQFAKQILYDHL